MSVPRPVFVIDAQHAVFPEPLRYEREDSARPRCGRCQTAEGAMAGDASSGTAGKLVGGGAVREV